LEMDYYCKKCGEVCIEKCGMVICQKCGYEVTKDAADKANLLEVCKRASKAHCLRGTILQHDLIKAVAKAEKL